MFHFPQVLRAGRDTVILCNTCILTINGRLSRCFSRCRNAYQEGRTTPSYPLPAERAVLVRFSEKFYQFSFNKFRSFSSKAFFLRRNVVFAR